MSQPGRGAGPPARIFLHIGLHKTGTTYLQNLMHANRADLTAQGVDYPGGPDEPQQGLAVWDLQGGRPGDAGDVRVAGSWAALVETISTCGQPTALVSVEWLSLSRPRHIRKLAKAFPESELSVIVTVRDLGRVVVSAWQEEIKNDQTWTWEEFVSGIRDPERIAANPARGFWNRQDVAAICARWEAVVPGERVHIVTVPQPPTPSTELLSRFASVVGFDPYALTEDARWTNETVGVAATEVIRRLNLRLSGRLNRRKHAMVVKTTLAPMLASRTDPLRFTLPEAEYGWVARRAEEMIGALRARGYPVVGDLAELRPQREEGRRPDEASDDELLEASLDALALLSERFATAWWQRRKADEPLDESLVTKTQGMIFRGRQRTTALATRSPAAVRLMGVVAKARDRGHRSRD